MPSTANSQAPTRQEAGALGVAESGICAYATSASSLCICEIGRLRPPTCCRTSSGCSRLSAAKIDALERRWLPQHGSPVFTVEGQYMARGWTEWTQGFQFGAALLQFDATGDRHFLELGRNRTLERMAPHLTHVGVHDHGFNNVSTYGNLWRLAGEGRFEASEWERHFYELALKVSGAVQARRWTRLPDGGFIHSFNGPHSLFVDTIRSLRSLALGHRLGPPAQRRTGRADQPVRPPGAARQGHRGLQRLLRPRPRPLRRARPHDARGDLQHRSTDRSAGPTASRATRPSAPGREAWRGRCSGLPSSSSSSDVSDDLPDEAFEPSSEPAPPPHRMVHARGRLGDLRFLHRARHRQRRHPLLGHRRARTRAAVRDGRTVPPIRSTTTSRSTVPRPALPRRGCCGSAAICRRAATTARATCRLAWPCSTR